MEFIIVDDNAAFKESVSFFLERIHKHNVIGMVEDGESFLKLSNINQADIILMDIEMPKLNGIETVKRASTKNPALKFIAITAYNDKAYLYDLIAAGFKGYILKDNFYDEFEEAITRVSQNKLHFPGDIDLLNNKKGIDNDD